MENIQLKDYQDFVAAQMSPDSVKDLNSMLGVAGLGIAGEGGEFADLVKKVLYHGMEFDETIRQKMIKELGDSIFYITFAATHICGLNLDDIWEANYKKLKERYKSGKFTTEEFLAKELKKVED